MWGSDVETRQDADDSRADGWIPVSERLPEEAMLVLVWTGDGDPGREIAIGFMHKPGSWWTDNYEYEMFVTHWRPLPDPPKEDH